ncbi:MULTISPECIES: tRNA/rRNA methyltransferase [unclassified Imperialibacter]|uniref:tRNA/rRNA methyltransferase n=1 Tax=unclassified Imperialibacter TaxID=2629706 RepID=UPI0012544C72|nr:MULTISPECIES: tRNA/rRNA methyltransferase [unclassified Imperialibacter]CAD5289529.1 tRNA (cytidine/uridine-2'-O-)-methyltransferase TrmJ [Imperialibacter sp. 89]CAD5289771.1 tRNA (cytidine/uridine-2'-O-)-methyltransferase TrmJ [Imperialibacter sp. 75]VVT34569.1 tRNA (cytidine/uridine-2'-O-)-methyltransferase TrmJ [Imperialibacter sp. EC-SDR9]
MTIHFVLSHPAVSENIGFASRAINAMGFGSLRLVNPTDHLSQQARKTAYGSHDILESALVYPSLADALSDIDLSIATTAKKRLGRHDYHSPEKVGNLLQEKGRTINSVAIVFGSERDGLTKEEIGMCDLISSIPLAAPHPSLNLAQSVLIYAWELSKASFSSKAKPPKKEAEEGAQKALKEKAKKVLSDLDVPRQPSLYNRLKDRLMTADAEDTRLMLALARFIEHRLKNQ